MSKSLDVDVQEKLSSLDLNEKTSKVICPDEEPNKKDWYEKHYNSHSCHPGYKPPKKGK